MKANEFIRKFGLGAAKNILHGMDDASEFTVHMSGDAWDKPTLIDAVGLRRIVESHELVERLGGIDGARKELANLCDSLIDCAYLCQAIADVESCQ